MTEKEQKSLILRQRYDLTVPERSLIERGLLLAESLGKKEYICPILGVKFVLIPAGTFMMGSPEDEEGRWDTGERLHHVTISKPFYMQITQVTQGQWKKVMGNNPSYFKGDYNLPVESVSWNDVQEFISELNSMEGVDKYRLPTEAEWEYACRTGSTTAYCFGDDPRRLGEYAWYFDNSGSETRPAGKKKPNAWGLYDMHGNVWERVQDWWGKYPSGSVTDPEGPSSGSDRVRRGGCWVNDAKYCRSAYRYHESPGGRSEYLGFRLLRAVEQDSYESDRRVANGIGSEQVDKRKKQIAKSKEPVLAKVRETGRDEDFIAYDDGTVLDTKTNLMWAAEDNGRDINWQDAKIYCEDYRGGGYTDWRMPTLDELAGLYDEDKSYGFDNDSEVQYDVHLSELIQLSGWLWSSEKRGSDAAYFVFYYGIPSWAPRSGGTYRALPVRSDK